MPKSKAEGGSNRAPGSGATSRRRIGRLEEPLDYMLRIMQDPKADDKRRDAMAKEALPYRHAKRAGVVHALKPLVEMSEAELEIVDGEGGTER